LDRRIRFQQSRTQEFAEFPAGLSQFFTGRLEGGILHRLLMGRAELGPLVFSQIGKSGTALILKLAKRPVGAIGRRLRENVWRELRDAREGGNKKQTQFQFHLLIL